MGTPEQVGEVMLPVETATYETEVNTETGAHHVMYTDRYVGNTLLTVTYGGTPIPVVVNVYNDRSFDFITKSPPAAALLKKAAGIAKGSGVPNKEKVGQVTRPQIDEICKQKMADLNARDLEHARALIEGTARSMGIDVIDG